MGSLIKLLSSIVASLGIALTFMFIENAYINLQPIAAIAGIVIISIISAFLTKDIGIAAIGSATGYSIAMIIVFSSPFLFNMKMLLWNPLEPYGVESLLTRLLMVAATAALSLAVCLSILKVGAPKVAEKEIIEHRVEKVTEEVATTLEEKVTELLRCDRCGGEVAPDAIFCPYCGKKLKE